MALEKTVVPVIFNQGIDTSTDEKLILPGKLTRLENATIQKNGRIEKRSGTKLISNHNIDGIEIYAKDIANHKNEVLLFTDDELYSKVADGNLDEATWVKKRDHSHLNVEVENVYGNLELSLATPDCETILGDQNRILLAWETSTSGIQYLVKDLDTGANVMSPITLTGFSRPRALKSKLNGEDTFILLLYNGSSSLTYLRLDNDNPQTVSASGILPISSGVMHSDIIYDAISTSDGNFGLAFSHNSGHTQFAKVNCSGTTVYSNTHSPRCSGISLFERETGNIGAVYSTVSGVVATRLTSNLSGFDVYPKVIDTVLIPPAFTDRYHVRKLTGASVSSELDIYFYEVHQDSDRGRYVKAAWMDSSANVYGGSKFIHGGALNGTCFKDGTKIYNSDEDRVYVPVSYDVETFTGQVNPRNQQTNFIVTTKSKDKAVADSPYVRGRIVSRIKTGNCGDMPSKRILPKAAALPTSGTYALATTFKTDFTPLTSGVEVNYSVGLMKFDFNESLSFSSLGDNSFFSGGLLNEYDSNSLYENGFNIEPYIAFYSDLSFLPGSMPLTAGTYQYVCQLESVDSNGIITRSAPSLPVTVTLTGNGINALGFYTTAFTDKYQTNIKAENTPNPNIAVYRTEANGTLFYKIQTTVSTINKLDGSDIQFLDVTTNAELIRNEIIYTTGGTLENNAAPACRLVEVHNNRLFVDSEDGLTIWYSHEMYPGYPVEFSEALTISVEAEGGRMTGFKSFNNKFLIFKNEKIYFVTGEGALETGEGSTLTTPEEISTGIGCISKGSIVQTPIGIFFQSKQGIYLIDGSLNLNYIGKEVDYFIKNKIIESSCFNHHKNEVYFLVDGKLVVYNLTYNQWYTWANDSVSFSQRLLSVDPALYSLDENRLIQFSDDCYFDKFDDAENLTTGEPIGLKIVTGWLNFSSSIDKFQRVDKVIMNMNYHSPHMLKVKVAYDYKDYTTEKIISSEDILKHNKSYRNINDEDVYEESENTDNGIAYRYTLKMKKPKCNAVKFSIEDYIPPIKTLTPSGINTASGTISTDQLYCSGFPVKFSGNDLPSPLIESTPYYVIKVNDNVIQLASTVDDAFEGNSISLTTSGSGSFKIIPDVTGKSFSFNSMAFEVGLKPDKLDKQPAYSNIKNS